MESKDRRKLRVAGREWGYWLRELNAWCVAVPTVFESMETLIAAVTEARLLVFCFPVETLMMLSGARACWW